MSSRGLLILVEEALEGAVLGGVVGGVVLPAVPDDVEPGAGEDADGVGVVVAAGAGAVVEVGGPGVGAAGVAGEVGDGVAELFVAGPAEPDGADLAGLSGGGGDAGQAGQRFGGGERGAAVADLGEQPGGADRPARGRLVKMCASACAASCWSIWVGEGLDLLDEGGRARRRSARVMRGLGGAVGAGGAAGRGGQAGVQHGGVGPAGVAHAWPASRRGASG